MNPTVSIIVPVYNAQRTLRRCIDSVLNQTFSDFELLLVDDGSKDESGEICDSYALRDERVKVFHIENSGVSAARNVALDRARGEYLQFLDSDDWITADATQQFVRAARKYDCDMVISDFYRVVNDRLSVKGDIEEAAVMSREEFAAHMMENPADFYYGVLWNKLFRRSIVEEHALRMNPEISWCEDFLFNMEYIRYADRFYALNVPLYYYVKAKGSLASQGSNLFTTLQMKATVFDYYNQLYKDIWNEEEYQKRRRKVYRFLLDAAGDGAVMPAILPSVRKLGDERVTIEPEMLGEVGIMADSYREWKLLERCVESTAIKYALSNNEAMVLLALGHDGFRGKRQDLAELAHISRMALSRSLSQLESRGLVQLQKDHIQILPKGAEPLDALEHTIQDWKDLRFSGFTEDEIKLYKELHKRIRRNISAALK